ncbi:MAG: cobyric acid synthase [Methanomassiliicoccus sp.]|nr:cobyric acid synthase [Methanomassiliicoccus sp.]
MSSIMVQGTSSGAGKTTVAALLCRHFAGRGFKVAPFKASNLSLNSFVTAQGEEIGVSQAYQAWACGREPEGCMNPVLLKPKGNGSCQLILSGRPYADLARGGREMDRAVLRSAVKESFQRLAEANDVVVIEGSGSPAEINLRRDDIANMATAEMAGSPVVLVGDIERGGVFAGLYGTYALLEERHRRLVKAFLINRFRGDESILQSGIDRMEELLGVPSIGVLPFADLKFPAEDSLDMNREQGTGVRGRDMRKGWLDNLDELYAMSVKHLDYATMEKIAFS